MRRTRWVTPAVIVAFLGLLGVVLQQWPNLFPRKTQAASSDSAVVRAPVAPSEGIRVRVDTQILSTIKEPSGLTASGVVDSASGDSLLLAVDDEDGAVFAIPATHESGRPAGLRIAFTGDVKDLEDIAWDGRGTYFAVTSHRTRQPSKAAQRKLLVFSFPPNARAAAPIEPTVIDLVPALRRFLDSAAVPVDTAAWQTETGDAAHPYALEIEGLAAHGDVLFLGLKWPLLKERAVLLRYDRAADRIVSMDTLDLGGNGITALTMLAPTMLGIGASLPQKPGGGAETCGNAAYRKSTISVYAIPATPREPMVRLGQRDVSHTCGKLEGVALSRGELVLMYDGKEGTLARRSRAWVDSLLAGR